MLCSSPSATRSVAFLSLSWTSSHSPRVASFCVDLSELVSFFVVLDAVVRVSHFYKQICIFCYDATHLFIHVLLNGFIFRVIMLGSP